ncbi:MAG: hypothetical protein OXT74_06650 [Candidatus Poribacteria bacterium]|nr:hypothetical protein [Candidatus Poribacteria bacterium]
MEERKVGREELRFILKVPSGIWQSSESRIKRITLIPQIRRRCVPIDDRGIDERKLGICKAINELNQELRLNLPAIRIKD